MAASDMRVTPTLVALAMFTVALAGCSEETPSGGFSTTGHDVKADGTVTLAYQARVVPQDQPTICQIPPVVPNIECKDPYTNVSAHFMMLAQPSSEGYTLWFTSVAGNETEIGALVENETGEGMYDLPLMTFEENHEDQFDAVELRMGDVVIASAGTTEGEQTFELNAELTMISAEATWEGKKLMGTVGGATNASYTGWLVATDEAGELLHEESFAITGDGAFEYEAQRTIGEFTAFHIHLAGSKVNVALGDIA